MGKLGKKQRQLNRNLHAVEAAAFALGYDLVREDAKRDTRVHGKFGKKKGYAAAYSVHKLKLAQDYSLFLDGKYIEGDEADRIFGILHDIGDIIGMARRIDGDLGHFSMEHQGHR